MFAGQYIELDPNREQKVYFLQACGIARFAYNWGLQEWKRQYESGEKPNELAIRRLLNSVKREEFPWMLEVTKRAAQEALVNLGKAFKNFFDGKSKYPKFKKRGRNDRFRMDNGPLRKGDSAVKIEKGKLWVPKLGWVRMKHQIRLEGQIKEAVIFRRVDRWFVSFRVELVKPPKKLPNRGENQAVGVDLGVKTLATLSTGEKVEGPKPLKRMAKRLRRRQKSLSRKKKGSKNREKAKIEVGRLHYKISNIRKDSLHKLTHYLVMNFDIIGIENLNISGMLKNHNLAKAIADMGLFEFRRQVKYKAKWYCCKIVEADRFFPSSKLCSFCNTKNDDLTLSDRFWTCKNCNTLHDRDINAAINLKNLATATASSAECQACGEISSTLPEQSGEATGLVEAGTENSLG